MRRVLLVVVLAACGSSSDGVIVRVVDNAVPTPAGWDAMAFDQVGETCLRGAGKAVFQRPAYTTHPAEGRCYEHAGSTIYVSLALPDAAWGRAGWRRCAPDREREVLALCR